MDIQVMTNFFMWCSIFNFVLLVFSFLVLALAGDFVYRMHGKWFPMPRETFNVAVYAFIGIYKIIFFAFNLVPWLALIVIA